MPLSPGTRAPDIMLTRDDDMPLILHELTHDNPVVLAFFKVSCPTCQLTFPFLERLYRRMEKEGAELIGIGQDGPAEVKEFRARFDITFPIALDAPSYTASRAYDVRHVPTIYIVETDGLIARCSVGFVKDELEQLNRYWADAKDWLSRPLFEPDEDVPVMQPG